MPRNINVFALSFILAISASITLLDILLLRVLVFLSRFRKGLPPRIDRWIQDGIFQLQRRAYEARAEGTWTNTDEEIPVTSSNQQLSDLSAKTVPQTSSDNLHVQPQRGSSPIADQAATAALPSSGDGSHELIRSKIPYNHDIEGEKGGVVISTETVASTSPTSSSLFHINDVSDSTSC